MIAFYAPTERVQGVVQRIFLFHVPMAWRANPQAPPEMLLTLAVSMLAMTLVYAALLIYRTQLELTTDENRALDTRLAQTDALPPTPALRREGGGERVGA